MAARCCTPRGGPRLLPPRWPGRGWCSRRTAPSSASHPCSRTIWTRCTSPGVPASRCRLGALPTRPGGEAGRLRVLGLPRQPGVPATFYRPTAPAYVHETEGSAPRSGRPTPGTSGRLTPPQERQREARRAAVALRQLLGPVDEAPRRRQPPAGGASRRCAPAPVRRAVRARARSGRASQLLVGRLDDQLDSALGQELDEAAPGSAAGTRQRGRRRAG